MGYFMDKDSDWFGDVVKIALGIALGGLILWRITDMYFQYRVNEAAVVFQQSLDANNVAFNAVSGAAQRQRDSVALDKRVNDQRIQRAEAAVEWRERDASDRKLAAWQSFYHPSPKCSDSTRSDVSIECGNAYILARRQFEASWNP